MSQITAECSRLKLTPLAWNPNTRWIGVKNLQLNTFDARAYIIGDCPIDFTA
jgi:hypothetical protein